MTQPLKTAVDKQRQYLESSLGSVLSSLAQKLAPVIDDRKELEKILLASCSGLSDCKYLYVLDADGVQLTANITHEGVDDSQFGRDRSLRPYMAGAFGDTNFRLSEAYISRRKRRPSLTAVQVIRNNDGERIGFLNVDYDLRELAHTDDMYQESLQWRQIKGDPSIRSGLFLQSRVQSPMDDHMEDVFSLMNELMTLQGVYHGKFHFASSRATVWHVDDPFIYHILTIEELIDPDTCLAFPHRPYPERAVVPPDMIMPIFKQFGALRFADETIYLRAGSLNLINGMIGLNFSCDGSHYLPFSEFMGKGLDFWFGAGSSATAG
jgi:hypothetical protein